MSATAFIKEIIPPSVNDAITPRALGPWRSALRLSVPVALGFFPVGVAFGVYALQVGLPWPVVLALSCFVFAGSSEFLAASMMAAHAPWASVVLTGISVNFRHVFYGLSVARVLPAGGMARRYNIATLCDETYAILAAQPAGGAAVSVRLGFLNHLYWTISVAVGVLLGSHVGQALKGIEFCLPALFAALCVEQWREGSPIGPMVLGAGLALGLCILAPQALLLGAVSGSAVGLTMFAAWRSRTTP